MTTAFGLNPRYPDNRQKPLAGARLASNLSLLSGLVGFWPFLEGDGGLVTDYSQNNKPGQLTSTANWAAGPFGKAIDFNTAGGLINCGTAAPLRLTTAFSMSIWAYTTVSPVNGEYPRLMSKLHSVTGGFNGYEMVKAAADSGSGLVHGAVYGQIAFNGSLGAISDVAAMPLGQWVHYVITFNSVGGIMNIYRDGVLRNSNFAGGAFGDNSLNYEIGASSEFGSTHRFQGRLDLPTLWNRVVTADEARALHNDPFVLLERVATPSRGLVVFQVTNTYNLTLNVDGISAATIIDGGTLYKSQSIDGFSAASPTSSLRASNAISIDAIADLTAKFPYLLTLSIDGISAITLLPGQQYFSSAAIQGIADIARLPGSGFFDTLSVDATCDVQMSQIGLKLLTLSIDGISAITLSNTQSANIGLSVDGFAACTISPTITYQLTLSLAGICTIYEGSSLNGGGTDSLYNFLALTSNDTTSQSCQRFTPGDQNPTAQSDVSVACTGVFNRTISQVLSISQDAVHKKPTEIVDTFHIISQVVSVQRVRNRTVAQTLAMTQDAEAYRAFLQTLSFSQTAAVTRVRFFTVAQTLGLTQSADRKTVLGRALTQTLVMGQDRLIKSPIMGTINTSSPTIFEFVQPSAQAILVPSRCLVVLGVPSQTVILPCPQLGDSQALQSTVNLKRTMTGDTYTYIRKTDLQKLKYTFQLGSYKAVELEKFLVDHCHEIITLINHKGETWYVNLTNNPFEFTTQERWQNKGERHDITLEFEGVQL